MNPLKAFKLFRAYEKAQSILKEKVSMNKKVAQIATLAVTVIGTLGVSDYASGWVGHHAAVFGGLVAAAQVLHALFPSIFAAPNNPAPPDNNTLGKAAIILFALLLVPVVHAQSVLESAPQVQNMYAGGVSYSVGGNPAIAGTALYAHALSNTGTYAFSAVDALPNTIKPFTVSTNVGAGIAQRVATIAGIDVYVPTAAGISWSGSNTGWQWNAGALASVHVRGNYYVMPSVRFLKSSVSGGTGYQPILGVLLGWGS